LNRINEFKIYTVNSLKRERERGGERRRNRIRRMRRKRRGGGEEGGGGEGKNILRLYVPVTGHGEKYKKDEKI